MRAEGGGAAEWVKVNASRSWQQITQKMRAKNSRN